MSIVSRLSDLEARVGSLENPLELEWSLYLIKDAGGFARYVGITKDLRKRAYQHFVGPDSAAYEWLHGEGEKEVHVVAKFPTLEKARDVENLLITSIPGLLNRDVEVCRMREARKAAQESAYDRKVFHRNKCMVGTP